MSDSSYSKEKEYVETIKMLGELDETSLRLVKSGVELLYARERVAERKNKDVPIIA